MEWKNIVFTECSGCKPTHIDSPSPRSYEAILSRIRTNICAPIYISTGRGSIEIEIISVDDSDSECRAIYACDTIDSTDYYGIARRKIMAIARHHRIGSSDNSSNSTIDECKTC